MVGELFIWYGYPPYRVEPAEFKVSFEFNRGQSTKTLRSHNLEKLKKDNSKTGRLMNFTIGIWMHHME